jgi:Ran GTPase-activating protein (RanGAP) involved in mRNA processing and transport
LVDTGLGTAEGWVLSAIIGLSSSLTELDVRSNLIGAVGAEQLAKAILASASIRRLSEIPLAELRENQISELDLSNKSLGPTEGRVLATILMLCTSLEEINLLGNCFDDEATSMLLGVKEEAARAAKLAEGLSKEEAERERERVKAVTDAINVKSAAKERRKGLSGGDEASGEGSIPVDTQKSAAVPAEDGNFHAPQRKTVKLLIPDYGSDPEEEEEEEGGRKRRGSLEDEEEEEGGAPKASDHWERGILRGEDRPKVASDSTEKVLLRLKTLCGLKHGQPHITFKHLSASCARLLAADIVTSSSVTQLNLQENTLGFEGGRAISLGIRANTSLVEVNVEGFALPVLQLKGLEPVPNNKLDLSSKKLGQASAVLIASVIGAEATAFNALRVLNLRNNEIDDIGLSALSGAVADGAMGWLERLFLNKNHIGNVGLAAFAEAIKAKRMNMLKELGISLNRIGDPGLHALITVIKAGMLPCLTAIEVFPNPASSEAQEGLANFVNKKKRMPKLSPRKLGSGDPSYLSHRSGTEGALSHRSGTSAG